MYVFEEKRNKVKYFIGAIRDVVIQLLCRMWCLNQQLWPLEEYTWLLEPYLW